MDWVALHVAIHCLLVEEVWTGLCPLELAIKAIVFHGWRDQKIFWRRSLRELRRASCFWIYKKEFCWKFCWNQMFNQNKLNEIMSIMAWKFKTPWFVYHNQLFHWLLKYSTKPLKASFNSSPSVCVDHWNKKSCKEGFQSCKT